MATGVPNASGTAELRHRSQRRPMVDTRTRWPPGDRCTALRVGGGFAGAVPRARRVRRSGSPGRRPACSSHATSWSTWSCVVARPASARRSRPDRRRSSGPVLDLLGLVVWSPATLNFGAIDVVLANGESLELVVAAGAPAPTTCGWRTTRPPRRAVSTSNGPDRDRCDTPSVDSTASAIIRCSRRSRRRFGSGSRRRSPSRRPPRSQGWPHIVGRRSHADLRPDRQRQDAHRVPRLDRPPGHDAPPRRSRTAARGCSTSRRCGPWRSTSRRTCGPRSRASSWRPSGSASPFVAPEVAMRTGDTPSNDRQKLIRRPPDLLITTPETLYLMLTSSAARHARRRRHRDHRRDPRDGHHQARRPPGADARTARGGHRARRRSGSGCRPRSARSRRSPASSAATRRRARRVRSRSSTPASASRSRSRSSSRSRTCRRSANPSPSCAAARPPWRSPSGAPASGRASTRASSQQVLAHRSTIIFCNARRSGRTAGRQAQRAGHRAGRHRRRRSRAGQGPPRLARPRAAGGDRGPAEARRAARHRRHVARSSSASTWVRSISSSRSSRPGR